MFIIMAEVLERLISAQKEKGLWKGVIVKKGVDPLSHYHSSYTPSPSKTMDFRQAYLIFYNEHSLKIDNYAKATCVYTTACKKEKC